MGCPSFEVAGRLSCHQCVQHFGSSAACFLVFRVGPDSCSSSRDASRRGFHFAGPARTLRYVPYREDLADVGRGYNAQKQVIDDLKPDEVLVISARQDPSAGTIGDIMAMRAQVRGAAAIVTDGGVRDSAQTEGLDIPVLHAGTHPAAVAPITTSSGTG